MITGELYFKLIGFCSTYGYADSIKLRFKNGFDSLAELKNISKEDRQVLDFVKLLKENELINKPCFHLRIDSDEIVTSYVNESEYNKIKDFDRQRLINENKKVVIKLNGHRIGNGIIDCQKIISTEKVDGKTYWRK